MANSLLVVLLRCQRKTKGVLNQRPCLSWFVGGELGGAFEAAGCLGEQALVELNRAQLVEAGGIGVGVLAAPFQAGQLALLLPDAQDLTAHHHSDHAEQNDQA